MNKVELLLRGFDEFKKGNFTKLVITEIVIFFIVIGEILASPFSVTIKIITAVVLFLIMFLIFLSYRRRRLLINFCQTNYPKAKNEILQKLENQQKSIVNSFDYLNETLLFQEIVRTLKTYH